ncbi:Zn-dependent hydrolase [Siminovitchia acidinfaciens]|uniref:Zn-dependent hydrolase n=1 Tax=Siminovitchia acidinfaciens TaxID=2321395 RepID=A0A429Y596_9BACI|nr:Zn-dependent hydrolase [Siminovitchia acidinfaciens]RST76489.1 Zn-dependent hydrolase [Siminovitchia acidinfaciens]
MEININRLISDINRYAEYGRDNNGGVTRPSFTKADLEVRHLFINELKDMDLQVMVDGAGNIWGRKKGSGKKQGCIVVGSHLDSVPNGGKYDGPLGVLMAKEIIKTLGENNVTLDHDLEIVSFTAEESNDFNLSTFGSRSFVGRLHPDMLQGVLDSKGMKLSEALESVGGGLNRYPEMHEKGRDIKAFVELHIEQGQRLESNDISLAVIDNVVGTYRTNVTVTGQSNHSGTTMMEHRQDALTAAAEMIIEVERYCREYEGSLVGTVGKIQAFPNAVNIIPGQVNFTFELRGENELDIKKAVSDIGIIWKWIKRKRKVFIEQELFLDQKPIELDHDLVNIMKETAEDMEEPYMVFPSMAVHDAAHIASITKSVMLFVKSIDGKSHCPEEYSTPEDIEKVGNVMLNGVLKMDRKLPANHPSNKTTAIANS